MLAFVYMLVFVPVEDNHLRRISGVVGEDQLGLAVVASLAEPNGDHAGPAGRQR
jgi:hypothetical protein